jgi:hypothetical protein
MPGIVNTYNLAADIPIASSATLQSLNLGPTGTTGGIPIAANQELMVEFWVKVTVGATGGIRAQVVVPSGGAKFSTSIRLENTVAPSVTVATQQSSAAFTNALANAGTHSLYINCYIKNGSTAGKVDLQMAQNTVDVLTLTILEGGEAVATNV